MAVPTPQISNALRPLSWLYGFGVSFRNALFQWGILKEHTYPLPIICLGNLTVGGTGKTPHTEYLIRLLQEYRLAVLSRGYGRRTHGYLLADEHSTAQEIGDEPYQIHQKFPEVFVTVDEDRVDALERLTRQVMPEVVLLDDAYQHRYVKAGLNILLTDYHRLMTRDALLPAGRLREALSGKERAHLILITKCPDLTSEEKDELQKELQLRTDQKLFFSRVVYAAPVPVFQAVTKCWEELNGIPILLLAGIANPAPLQQQIQKYSQKVVLQEFRDHHLFTQKELEELEKELKDLGPDALLFTTEKDAARLKSLALSSYLQQRLYQVPITVEIQGQENFDECILNYVTKEIQ